MLKLASRLVNIFVDTDEPETLQQHLHQSQTMTPNADTETSGSEASTEECRVAVVTPTDGERRSLDILYRRIEMMVPCPRDMVKNLFELYRQRETWEARRQMGGHEPVRGLEYLDDEADDHDRSLTASFRRITYRTLLDLHGFAGEETPPDATSLVNDTVDTYIVSRRLDFIYTMTLEAALLGLAPHDRALERRGEDDQTFGQMRNALRQLGKTSTQEFQAYIQEVHFCTGATDEVTQQQPHAKLCPCEWVVYTKMNSLFYQYYKNLFTEDEQFCFGDCQVWAQSVQRVSFFIVLLLCGDMQGFDMFQSVKQREQEDLLAINIGGQEKSDSPVASVCYRDTNQWVKLPLWTLKLWRLSPHCRIK